MSIPSKDRYRNRTGYAGPWVYKDRTAPLHPSPHGPLPCVGCNPTGLLYHELNARGSWIQKKTKDERTGFSDFQLFRRTKRHFLFPFEATSGGISTSSPISSSSLRYLRQPRVLLSCYLDVLISSNPKSSDRVHGPLPLAATFSDVPRAWRYRKARHSSKLDAVTSSVSQHKMSRRTRAQPRRGENSYRYDTV